MNEATSVLTDLHMVVLALLTEHTTTSTDKIARVLGLSEATIDHLVADLEAEGLIEVHTVH